MNDVALPTIELLSLAISFASRAHQHQFRKDRVTPYIAHPLRVMTVLSHHFGIEDTELLIIAVLHDTIEDTTTDYDDLEKHFGVAIAESVALLSKDKRLPYQLREERYLEGLLAANWRVQTVKLADVFDNLHDSTSLSPRQQLGTIERSKHLLNCLREHLHPESLKAFQIVETVLEVIEKKMLSKNPR